MKEITSMKDIADLCGVSYSTVSRVLSGKSYVKEETRQKVMEVVNKSNFKPNPLAQYLKSGESKTICLMLPSYGNLIFPIVMRGVDEVARKKGYKAFFNVTDEREEQEEALYKEMLRLRASLSVLQLETKRQSMTYTIREFPSFL